MVSDHPKSPPPPLRLGTLVCGYTLEELPVSWLRVFHRFEHAMSRSRWHVRVRLFPIEELPEEVDILVVPPELEERARRARPGLRVIVTTREDAAAAVQSVMSELETGLIVADVERPGEPRIISHRGTEVL